MLEKYRTTIESLPAESREVVIRTLGLPSYRPYLYDMLLAADWSQADVVLALVREGSPASLRGAEALVGRPIEVCPPGLLQAAPDLSLYARAQWCLGLLGPEVGAELDRRRVTRIVPNPRLPTTPSWGRFRILKVGMSVGQFLVRGGRRRDVREWVREGAVELTPL